MNNTKVYIVQRLDILCELGCPRKILDALQDLTTNLDLLPESTKLTLSFDILRLTYSLEIDLTLDHNEKQQGTNTQ